MPTDLPAWLSAPHPDNTNGGTVSPADVQQVAALREHLAPGARLALLGSLSRHRAHLARAIAKDHDGDVFAARLAGCRSSADIALAIGWACGAAPAGDRAAIARQIDALPRPLIVLDDADVPGLAEAISGISGLCPGASWLVLVARTPASDLNAYVVTLPDEAPPEAPKLRDLSTRIGALALLPAGLPTQIAIPEQWQVPGLQARQALRTELADLIRTNAPPNPAAVAREIFPLLEPCLGIAEGGNLPASARWEDAIALRWLGEVMPDPDAACRASAAAAALLSRWGQPAATRRVLDAARRRNTLAGPSARARLEWAEADMRLRAGDHAGARAAWDAADTLLQDAGMQHLRARMARQRASALTTLGEIRPAARAWRDARTLSRQAGHLAGVAAGLRGAADLAVQAGELLSAEALYDQAEGTPSGPIEHANRLIGQAGLALARGELGRTRSLIDQATHDDPLPLIAANLARRTADLALREGRHDVATEHATRAAECYRLQGELSAAARCTRMLGDIQALTGDLAGAMAHYQQATELQARLQDRQGLARTMRHAAAAHSAAGAGDQAAIFHDLADDLERARPDAG